MQVPGLTGITQVSGGELYSLALRSDGTVWAWGDQILAPAAVSSLTGVTCNNIGTVLGQSPAAGTTQHVGSAVSITLGSRPKTPCP